MRSYLRHESFSLLWSLVCGLCGLGIFLIVFDGWSLSLRCLECLGLLGALVYSLGKTMMHYAVARAARVLS